MKAKFKRDMNCNYMILEKNSSSYQVVMFCRNEIDGFLRGVTKCRDGEESLFYDITSKQNLERIFERKNLGFEEIKDFFYSWQDAANEAERYLLNPAFLRCDPEYIYYDLSEKKYYRVFYPTEDCPELPEGLENLSEFLMEKVERRDFDALDVVYRFHHDVKEGNFFLKEIIKTIEEIKVRKPEGKDLTEAEEFLEQEGKDFSVTNEEIPSASEESLGEHVLGKIGKFFSGKKNKKGQETKKKRGEVKNKDENAVWKRVESDEQNRVDYKKQEGERIVVGTWMEEENAECSKTVLLGRRDEIRLLKRVRDGKIFPLDKLPVLVGKLEQEVDIYLNEPGISRLHARFYEEAGKVFLEDLNSTNGCILNSIPLQANEKAELSSGDRIVIGTVEFIYGIKDS